MNVRPNISEERFREMLVHLETKLDSEVACFAHEGGGDDEENESSFRNGVAE